eukprot:5116185-Prymnesium_polylepis.1
MRTTQAALMRETKRSMSAPHFLTLDETTLNNIYPLGCGQSAGATRGQTAPGTKIQGPGAFVGAN